MISVGVNPLNGKRLLNARWWAELKQQNDETPHSWTVCQGFVMFYLRPSFSLACDDLILLAYDILDDSMQSKSFWADHSVFIYHSYNTPTVSFGNP